MSAKRIEPSDFRAMLAIASELSDMRGQFKSRLEFLLANLGTLIGASRASAYSLSFSIQSNSSFPITEIEIGRDGKHTVTPLVGLNGNNLKLEALSKASRVTTVVGVPPWDRELNLRSLLDASRRLYSIQNMDDDSESVAILFERGAVKRRFGVREKLIVSTMWNSVRVSRRGVRLSIGNA